MRNVLASVTMIALTSTAEGAFAAECDRGLQGYRRLNGDLICLSQKMSEFLTCLSETSRGVESEQSSDLSTKSKGVDVKLQASGKATVIRGRGAVEIDTKNYEQSQKSLTRIFPSALIARCSRQASNDRPIPAKVVSTSVTGPSTPSEPPTGMRSSTHLRSECAVHAPLPLANRRPAGYGDSGRECSVDKHGVLVMKVTDRDGDFAECCVDLSSPVNLRDSSSICADYETQKTEEMLHVKIEVPGTAKQLMAVEMPTPPGRQRRSYTPTDKQKRWNGLNRICIASVGEGPVPNEIRLHAIGFQ